MRDERRESRVGGWTMGCAMLSLAMVLAGAIRTQAQCTIDPVTGGRECAPAPGAGAGASAPAPGSRLSALDSPHCRVTVGDGSAGSGTLVARNGHAGLVLTCSHLFDGSTENVFVVFTGGQRFAARVLERDRAHDLAALVIHRPEVEPIEVARSDGEAGGALYACGFGANGQFRCVRGEVVGQATPAGASHPSLVIRGAVRPGDSGGAVVNADGQLIGVVWGERDGLTYAAWGAPLGAILDRATGGESQKAATAGRGERRATCHAADLRPRLAELEVRVGALDAAKQPKGDYVRRDELQSYATRDDLAGGLNRVTARFATIDRRVEAMQPRVERVTKRPAGLLDGLSRGKLVAGALGFGGPLAVAVMVAGYLVRGRVKSQEPRAESRKSNPQSPVAVDTPPPPQRTVTQTHYVPYETDSFAHAHQWASEQVARKYPGATEMLQAQESLIKQYLAAEQT